jgi:hypothetical protein
VLGGAVVFGPLLWLFERWSASAVRDPAGTWGALWLGEQLSAHPYLTGGTLLLCVAFWSGLAMLILVGAARRLARWLATRLTKRARSEKRITRS